MNEENRFEILERTHGEGGFAKISKGRDKVLDRYVAIKTLKMIDEEDLKERFKREAKALAKMSHPNIPAIYDVIFKEDRMQIFFEFIEGIPLRKIIQDNSFPSMEEAKIWFSQIAGCLDHAHSLHIIHRDIKPDNIIISMDRNSSFLVDFGIALSPEDVKRITESGYVIGTPAYMSPEQREGRELSPASDIYCLGMTLFETLSGHLPEPGNPIELSEENEVIPPAIDELIKSCLNKDLNLRPYSGKDFIYKLNNAFRSDMPLSTLLTEARLHELYAGLSAMTHEDFHNKPKGQRLAVLMRLKDLLRSDKRQIMRPAAEMLALIIKLALHEETKYYAELIASGFEWGFNKEFGFEWHGDPKIREAIIYAGKFPNRELHEIICNVYLEFAKENNFAKHPHWYLHDLRIIANHLLANQYCDRYSEELAKLYDKMNEIGHQKEFHSEE